MMNLINNWIAWLKLVVILSCLILITVGFLFGYFYSDTSCIEDPLTYGIEKINEINSEDFLCTCSALSGDTKPFSFDENGVVERAEINQNFLPSP